MWPTKEKENQTVAHNQSIINLQQEAVKMRRYGSLININTNGPAQRGEIE